MRFLLDTHILLWVLLTPARLSQQAQALIKSGSNEVMFSAASIWEIAIKVRLGRGDFTARPEAVARNARDVGFAELPVCASAAACVADLPLHHNDPFDRLLVAQAIAGPMRLLTADAVLTQYSELITLVG